MRRPYIAALIGAVAFLFALLPAPASAQELGDLEERLMVLEAQIRKHENTAASYQAQLVDISSAIATEEGNLAEIRANLASTNERVRVSEARLNRFKEGLHARARELYKNGGALEVIGVVLGSQSMEDFIESVEYAGALATQDNALIAGVTGEYDRIVQTREFQRDIARDQRDILQLLEDRRTESIDVFARQQLVLSELAGARGEALEILGQLDPDKYGSERYVAIRQVAGHGMTISYEQWARSFLETLGAPVVRNNLVTVVAWQAAEGTQATWNPLATTMPAEGASNFNHVGVKNFVTKEQGIDASIRTLTRGGLGYEAVLDGLERAAPPMETAHALQQSRWCHGCAEGGYVISLIPAVEQYYDAYAAGQ